MQRTFRTYIEDRRYTTATMLRCQNYLASTIIEKFLIRSSLTRLFHQFKVHMPSGVHSSQAATSNIHSFTQGKDYPETTVILRVNNKKSVQVL